MKTSSLLSLLSLPVLALSQIITTIVVTRTTGGVPVPSTITFTIPPISSTVSSTPSPSTSSGSSSAPAPPVPTSIPFNTTVSYDPTYGNAAQSLRAVACSDGKNGLITRGFTTLGSLPNFPNLGGAPAVASWNSPNCGTCWQLTYTDKGTTTSVNVLAVDVAVNAFNISPAALDKLTGGRAVQLGRVNVSARQVAASVCGL